MSMEHKAFLFDTDKFNSKLAELLSSCHSKDDIQLIRSFINENIDDIKSPYDGEDLEIDWEDELENKDIQEYADFAITYCYNPDDEDGLSCCWQGILECLKKVKLKFPAEYYILGNSVKLGDELLDPGQQGLGIIAAQDIYEMWTEIAACKEKVINEYDRLAENDIYESTKDEIADSYDDLCRLFYDAHQQGMGLLMTF